jgi:hypothetical protein
MLSGFLYKKITLFEMIKSFAYETFEVLRLVSKSNMSGRTFFFIENVKEEPKKKSP